MFRFNIRVSLFTLSILFVSNTVQAQLLQRLAQHLMNPERPSNAINQASNLESMKARTADIGRGVNYSSSSGSSTHEETPEERQARLQEDARQKKQAENNHIKDVAIDMVLVANLTRALRGEGPVENDEDVTREFSMPSILNRNEV